MKQLELLVTEEKKIDSIVKQLGLLLTRENATASIEDRKTQTRRIDNGSNRYGQAGDLLYLQEPTQVLDLSKPKIGSEPYAVATVRYRDGGELEKPISIHDYNRLLDRKDWKRQASSRFMLKSFARHWFENLGVRKEYLQDCSEADAIAEGIDAQNYRDGLCSFRNYFSMDFGLSAIDSYKTLWDSINGKKYPWESNPLVRVISYKRVIIP